MKWTEPGLGVECQLYVRRITKNPDGTGVFSDQCTPAKPEDYENALLSLGVNLSALKKEQEELLAKNKELREQNEKLQASVKQDKPIEKLLNDTFSKIVGGVHKQDPAGRWAKGIRAIYELNDAHKDKCIPTDAELDAIYRAYGPRGRDAWREYVEQRETHTLGLIAVFDYASMLLSREALHPGPG